MKFIRIRPKTYPYLVGDDNNEIQKAKGTKKCVIKETHKSNICKNCLITNKVILKSQ